MTDDHATDLDIDAVRRALLDFYDARRRELPWRRDAEPYRVWVSEIMLQQTRVETVIPYYERWLARFPDVEALAAAPLDDVLKAWEGLGYYSRARNLHRAARVVRERHAGCLPAQPDALRALPGIGDYTAGAIASIAFGVPAPAVDGNVRRVLSRLLDLPEPTPAELRRLAGALVPRDRPGDFNQALMELGATLCSPRAPDCDVCPVADWCRSRARGTQAERPRPRPVRSVPEHDVGTAVVVAPSGRLLLVRRPKDGLLGGLWEFPGARVEPGESPEDAARRAALAAIGSADAASAARAASRAAPRATPRAAPVAGAAAACPVPGTPLGAVVHTFTHLRITYHAHRFTLTAEPDAAGSALATAAARGGGHAAAPATGSAPAGRGRPTLEEAPLDTAWVARDTLSDYALPAAQRRIAALLR